MHRTSSSATLIFSELQQPKAGNLLLEVHLPNEVSVWKGKKLSSSANGYFAICVLKDRAKGCCRHLSSRMLSSVIFPVRRNYLSLLWACFKPTECLGSAWGSFCLVSEFTKSQVLSSVGCDTHTAKQQSIFSSLALWSFLMILRAKDIFWWLMAAALYHQLQQSVTRCCGTHCAEIAEAVGEHMWYLFIFQQYGVLKVPHTTGKSLGGCFTSVFQQCYVETK